MTTPAPQTLPLDVALKQAIAHHQAGRLAEAEQLYRAILEAQPQQADANHNLGVLACQCGQRVAGLPYLKTALALNPMHEQYVLSYAEALFLTGAAQEALKVLEEAGQRGVESEATRMLAQRIAAGETLPAGEMQALAELFNAGRQEEVEQRSWGLIERHPRSGFAWKVLGTSLLMQGKDALAALEKAAEYSPRDAEAHNNLGNALRDLGRPEEAMASYGRALEIKPDFAEAHYNLGNALRDLGRLNEAAASYRRVSAMKPEYVERFNTLGIALQGSGQHEEAAGCYRRALEIKPDDAELHYNLGTALQILGRDTDATESYRRALELNPDYAEVHSNLGILLRASDRLDEAVVCYRRALEIRPDYVDAHNNLGNALRDLGQADQALACIGRALELAPDSDSAEGYNNLGLVLQDMGRLDEAAASYRRALELKPDFREANFNLALTLLGSGRLSEGWEAYERRYFKITNRNLGHRYWSGEDLSGKRLLIWGEQGVGDEIMFASQYGEMIERAGGCVIECKWKLKPLFERSFPRARVVTMTDPPQPEAVAGIDYQIAAGSLARWLRPTLERFPAAAGYLVPDPARVSYWKGRLGELGSGLKVGICWRSGHMAGARLLYYTKLAQWGSIFAVPGVHFVNLQYDECAAELEEARRRFGVEIGTYPEVDLYNDLDESAALTQALDLVISAGTAVAAIGGGLGVPTWMTGYGNQWDALGSEHYPWFPSVRLFLRRWDQAWEEILEEIGKQLKDRAAAEPAESQA